MAAVTASLALAGAGAGAGAAEAKIIDLGNADQQAAPTCPSSPCLAVSRTTGYQVKVGAKRGAFTVPADGKIVAWTIALGNPNAKQIEFFDKGFGESTAGLTVLKPGKRLYSRVVAQGPIVKLTPFFGQTVQFPLDTTISVKKGMVIGLTVPSWAPALTQLLDDGSSWRASRPKDKCDDTDTQRAQTKLRALTQYRCLYRARLTYSATLITTPKPNPPAPKPKTSKSR
jgi:hypothetical protein